MPRCILACQVTAFLWRNASGRSSPIGQERNKTRPAVFLNLARTKPHRAACVGTDACNAQIAFQPSESTPNPTTAAASGWSRAGQILRRLNAVLITELDR